MMRLFIVRQKLSGGRLMKLAMNRSTELILELGMHRQRTSVIDRSFVCLFVWCVACWGGLVIFGSLARASEPGAVTKNSLSKQLAEQAVADLAGACISQGDPARGEAIYKREKLGCVKCHVVTPEVQQQGRRSIGPDQTAVGDRLTPVQLVESVLYPSRVIAKGYESFVVLTDAGTVHKGVLVSQSPLDVVLMSPESGEVVTIARDQVDEMIAAASAMPEGLADQLTGATEFYDLIAYLASCRADQGGTPVVASDETIIREVPGEGGLDTLLAVAQPNGICFTYNPVACRAEAIWQGPLGWINEEGAFVLNRVAGQPFHIRDKPWKIDVGRLQFDYIWLGYKQEEGRPVFRYQLFNQEDGKQWTVTETIEAPSLLRQRIRFQIEHPADTSEVLTYWLGQTNYRNVTTNGQQAQRNQLEFLKPGQKDFWIDLSRRKPGQTLPLGFSVARVEGPKVQRPYLFEPTAFSFAPDGTLFVSTRTGGIWRRNGDSWNLFADGLQETLGVRVAQNGCDVYTMQKPELTLLEDIDRDGIADFYRSVANGFRFTGSYHEFAYGPVMNAAGELFFSTGLAASGHHEAKESKTGQMSSPLGYRGWVMKVDVTGQLTPFACGLRSPAGIGMNAADELFITDNQGDWVASSYLGHVEAGDFLGHPAALWDRPAYGLTPAELDHQTVGATVAKVPPLDEEQYRMQRKPPAVWLVHGDLTNSPGNPSFAPETGFGPFGGQAFIADISHRAIVRVALEKINGVYQGAVFPFIRPLASASFSTCFDPDGQLWVGSVGRGWTTGRPMIEVISYDGSSMPFEMQQIRLTTDGFEVEFTKPLADTAVAADAISVKRFHYLYWAEYGSDRQDVQRVPVSNASLSSDKQRLRFVVPVKAGHVYEIDLGDVRADGGAVLENNFAFYTVNEVPR